MIQQSMNLNIKARPQGFTLIEVLIAIVLLGIMMIGVYTLVNNSTETQIRVTEEDKDFVQIQTALNRIELDFLHIYSPLYFEMTEEQYKRIQKISHPSTGQQYEDFQQSNPYEQEKTSNNFPLLSAKGLPVPAPYNADSNSFAFFSTANRRKISHSKESNFTWIQYSTRTMDEEFRRENSKGNLEMIRYSYPLNPFEGDTDWSKIKPQVLLRNVKSMNISYWSAQKEKYVETIRELNDEQYTLKAIKIEIVLYDLNENEETITRVFQPLWPKFDVKHDISTLSTIQNQSLNPSSDGQTVPNDGVNTFEMGDPNE